MSCFVLLQKLILDIEKFARGGRIQEENEQRSEERSIKITNAHNFFFFFFYVKNVGTDPHFSNYISEISCVFPSESLQLLVDR